MHTSLNSYRATLFVGAAVLTVAAVTACWPQAVRAQNSPEALVEALVESVRAEDRAGQRALVHAAAPHEGRWYILLPGAPGG